MKNLDKMKQAIISEIQKMNLEEFEEFMEFVLDKYDISGLFKCSDCKRLYGECDEVNGRPTCSDRFKHYAMESASTQNQ